MKLIATFYSHFGAVRFMNKCKAANCKAKMMPVPRTLSSSCGTCVSYEFDRDIAETGQNWETKDLSPFSESEISEEIEQIVEVTVDGYTQLYCAKDS